MFTTTKQRQDFALLVRQVDAQYAPSEGDGGHNSVLEQATEIPLSRLTLEFASGQIVLGMNARSLLSAINVRIAWKCPN
jgi:hypothetical protein